MNDILLDKDGDMMVSVNGDISITESIRQAVLIRLRWIHDEWRLGPEFGFPWFEEMFVKNPNIVKISSLIRSEVMSVDGVTGAQVTGVHFDEGKREAKFTFTYSVGEEKYREEVSLNA